MSERGADADLARDVTALIRALEDLQSELQPGDRRRLGLPRPRDVLWVTSEVTIPATIVVLETNVQVLRLLQRALRRQTDEGNVGSGSSTAVRDRAETLGRETMAGLDRTLADLQSALAGRPGGEEAATLLAEARRLQEQVEAGLDADEALDADRDANADAGVGAGHQRAGSADVDVEAELQSIKDDLDDAGDDETKDGTTDG